MTAPHPEVELDVTGIAHGGVCVARLDGRVVFVADAIPGERVLARLSETRHESFWRADTVRVLDASEHRREHLWREADVQRDPQDRAGGAEFGYICLAHQRELKQRVLAEALQRFAKLELVVPVQAVPGDDEGNGARWRTRVTLHVDRGGRVGPYAARSHRVVPVTDLPLATEDVVREARVQGLRRGVSRVEVVSDDRQAIAVEIAQGRSGARSVPGAMTHRVRGRDYRHDALGFWQVHRQAAEVLSEAVLDAVDPERVDPSAQNLDLYGGVGLFAGAFADRFGPDVAVTSVESVASATAHAARNLADLPGARAMTAPVASYFGAEPEGGLGATIILDPPRKGAGREVVNAIARRAPSQVIYVACDPVALARDIGLFRERGYEVETLHAFDLFPHTHHLEAVARLVPADR